MPIRSDRRRARPTQAREAPQRRIHEESLFAGEKSEIGKIRQKGENYSNDTMINFVRRLEIFDEQAIDCVDVKANEALATHV